MSIEDKKSKLEKGIEELGSQSLEKGKKFAAKLPVLGHVTWLYSQLDTHKYFCMQDIEHRLIPPLSLEQCKLYVQSEAGGLPVAFVSWAMLNEETEKKYLNTQKLGPQDWRSGDKAWLIDFVTPWGGQDSIFMELKEDLLAGHEIHLLMPDGDKQFNTTTINELLQMKSDKKSKH